MIQRLELVGNPHNPRNLRVNVVVAKIRKRGQKIAAFDVLLSALDNIVANAL